MITSNVVQFDLMMRKELGRRKARCQVAWAQDEMLVRNSRSGYREGNLVKEYLGKIIERMFLTPWAAGVTAGDPQFTQQAEEAEVVSNELLRCTKFLEQLVMATFDSSWATTGWLELGHPLAQYPADLRRSVIAPRVDARDANPTSGESEDLYEEVSALPMGMDPSMVPPIDPFAPLPVAEAEPTPVVQTDLGYPWVVRVDPRYVVMNVNARTWEQVPWVARLRPMTVPELEFYTGRPKEDLTAVGMGGEVRELFEEVEGEDAADYGEVTFMVELWVLRDRFDPRRSDWLYCYPYGRPDVVFYDGPNPHGAGFLPLAPIKPNLLRCFYDTSMAAEMRILADAMHAGVKSVLETVENSLNKKTLVGPGAGLAPEQSKHLRDSKFKGDVECQDPNSVKPYEVPFDQALLLYLNWLKGIAQTSSSQSDLDRGTPIKNISARQTGALMESSGQSIKGMKKGVGDCAVQALMKMMYLMGRYGMSGYSREFQWGGRKVSMDRGTHDFTSSFVYNVKFGDSEQLDAETLLTWNQFLRTILTDTSNVLTPYFDLERLAQVTAEKFGEDPRLLASRSANRPGTGLGNRGEQGALSGSLGIGLTPGGDRDMMGGASGMGEHPERLPGSRGATGQQTSMNMLEGLKRTGMGG